MELENAQREPGFYWVLPVHDVDADTWDHDDTDGSNERICNHWSNQEQPAYWTGERWALLDTESWSVRWVGEQIVNPFLA